MHLWVMKLGLSIFSSMCDGEGLYSSGQAMISEIKHFGVCCEKKIINDKMVWRGRKSISAKLTPVFYSSYTTASSQITSLIYLLQ